MDKPNKKTEKKYDGLRGQILNELEIRAAEDGLSAKQLEEQMLGLFEITDEIEEYFKNPPSQEMDDFIKADQFRERLKEASIGSEGLLKVLQKFRSNKQAPIIQGLISIHLDGKRDLIGELKNKARYSTDREYIGYIPKQKYSPNVVKKLEKEITMFCSLISPHSFSFSYNDVPPFDLNNKILVVNKWSDIKAAADNLKDKLVIVLDLLEPPYSKETRYGKTYKPVEDHMKEIQSKFANTRAENAENIRRAAEKLKKQEKLVKHVFAIMQEKKFTSYEKIAKELIDGKIKGYRGIDVQTLKNRISEALKATNKVADYRFAKADIKDRIKLLGEGK